jgi:MFS family permease
VKPTPQYIQNLYLVLTLLSTLAASFIWGINTLFLLDAGLSNTAAFLANTFFTVGQVIFEVPTGIVADLQGRRTSYLLGTVTLAVSTLIYLAAWYIHAPFILWAVSSILLGLGFTFFSGATEAWLVDSLAFSGYKKTLDPVFAKGQMVSGIAMLMGSVGGGVIAQMTNLSVPYILRAVLLGITFIVAAVFMKDWGFTPNKKISLTKMIKELFVTSFQMSWQSKPVRWVMASSIFISGVSFYAFYAMQPFLLQLYGDKKAYAIAGLAAAIVAGAQIAGSMLVAHMQKFFKLRTSVLFAAILTSTVILWLVSMTTHLWIAIVLLCIWGLVSAIAMPIRQAYLNGLIPSKQRATILSFDSVVSSGGGAVIQPILGRSADMWSYSQSFAIGAGLQALSLPFILLARRQKTVADKME